MLKKLSSWIKTGNIKAGLFDLDDTLVDTHILFDEAIKAIILQAQKKLGLSSGDELLTKFREINNTAFVKLAVNPQRWNYVVQEMDSQLKTSVFTQGLPILMQIYSQEPRVLPGAVETLELFKKTGIPLGLITHANQDWTDFKLKTSGLDKYFDMVHVVDQNKHKGSTDWSTAIVNLGVDSSEVLAVGDNLKGDVIAARAAGVKHVVWIDKQDGWVMYRTGELPEGAHVIPHVGQLVSTLCASVVK